MGSIIKGYHVGSTLIQNVAKIECRCVSCSKTPSYPQLPNGYVNWIIVVCRLRLYTYVMVEG